METKIVRGEAQKEKNDEILELFGFRNNGEVDRTRISGSIVLSLAPKSGYRN